MDLKNLYSKHKVLGLPEFPENDEFAEWVEELIEMDAYYAGLISSQINGSMDILDENHYSRMNDRLKKYASIEEDKEVYNQCLEYMKSLGHLIKAVKQGNE